MYRQILLKITIFTLLLTRCQFSVTKKIYLPPKNICKMHTKYLMRLSGEKKKQPPLQFQYFNSINFTLFSSRNTLDKRFFYPTFFYYH